MLNSLGRALSAMVKVCIGLAIAGAVGLVIIAGYVIYQIMI